MALHNNEGEWVSDPRELTFDNFLVNWDGWSSRLYHLLENGWKISIRKRFTKSSRGVPLQLKGYFIYLKNNKGELARISLDRFNMKDSYELDWLIHHKKFKRQTPCHLKDNVYLSKEDIPELLALVCELQKDYPRKKKQLTYAEVIELKNAQLQVA